MALSGIDGLTSWISATNKSKTQQNLPGSIFPSASDSSGPTSGTAAGDPVAAFNSFMNETPAQRMQDSWLQQNGITRQQFDAMSETDKQKLLNQMKRDIEERMKEQAAQHAAPKGSQVNLLV